MGTQQLKRLKEFEREKRLTSARCSRFEFGKGNFGGNSKGKLLSPARRRECVRHVHKKNVCQRTKGLLSAWAESHTTKVSAGY